MQDDLAATADYEAVFFDNPAWELEDPASDWDELSDDYYDDDPTVERRNRAAKAIEASKANSNDPQTSRKRKRGNTAQNGGAKAQRVSSLTPNPASFQSVVWKRPDHDKNPVEILEPGEGEKVALLRNWREVFKNSHPSFGRSRMRNQRVLDYLESDTEPARSDRVNGLLEDEAKREVSTDRTSGVSSLENLRETDTGSGNISNTSPEKSLSPPSASKRKTTKKDNSNNTQATSHPTSSPSKGRKRKASISVDQQPGKNDTSDNTKEPNSKRRATKKAGQATQPEPATTPVRRSTRQTRSQK